MTALTVSANWFQIIGTVAAVALAVWAIWIAAVQLKGARGAALGQFILGVDQAFLSYEHVRRYINRRSSYPKPDIADFYRYIAIFERLGLLIEWKLVKIAEVNEVYGHRFENLIAYGNKNFLADFRTEFRPRACPEAWRGFIVLWHALMRYRDVDKPKPPDIPSLKEEKEDDPDMLPAVD